MLKNSPTPPPSAGPLRIDIVGIGNWLKLFKTFTKASYALKLLASSSLSPEEPPPTLPKSIPVQKYLPSPLRNKHLMNNVLLFYFIKSSAAKSSLIITGFRAFPRFGLFKVKTQILASDCTSCLQMSLYSKSSNLIYLLSSIKITSHYFYYFQQQ